MTLPRFLTFLFLGLATHLMSPAQTPTPAPDLAVNPESGDRPRDTALPTLFIAGDSTAAHYKEGAMQGWGTPFKALFDPSKLNVVNLARGGRSSRTFITEGLWDKLLAMVKPGDVVLLQFGHNDAGAINAEPPGSTRPLRARGTLAGLGEESEAIENVLTKKHEVVHTYGWYMRKMVREVKERGGRPVLLSLTLRNIWTDGFVERTSGRYRDWTRELAEAEKVPFVDLSRILADAYQEMGSDKVKEFFATDHTHTNPAGAEFTAKAVLSGLKGLRPPLDGLEAWLDDAGRSVTADTIGWLNLPERTGNAGPHLFLIGDSTVRNGRGDGGGSQWGWGDYLFFALDTRIPVVNRAVGGLSSRTFLTQGHWSRAKGLMRPGDLLLIQFGHNDSSPVNDDSRARGTLKGTGEETEQIQNLLTSQPETVHTYGWYLRQYIREAKAAGIKVAVCSPVPRKKWEDSHVVPNQGGYAEWAREVANSEGVPFIDLATLISKRYDDAGPQKVDSFFADEHTHTNEVGARMNAEVVAAELVRQSLLP